MFRMKSVQKDSVAVLVPTYSPGSYLKACLFSLENQDLPKDKFCVYIVLNGPSCPFREDVESLLQEFSFKYFFFYTEFAGVSHARNLLIDASSENFICFVDDDDVVSENYLSSLLKHADECCVSVSNVRTFEKNINDSRPNYIGRAYEKLSDNEASKFRSRKYYSSPCAKLIHRDIIGDIRFDSRLSKGEDALFMAMISPRVRLIKKAHSEPCYYVFLRYGSVTRKKDSTVKESKRLIFLMSVYVKMLFDSRYEKIFILTRVVATARHLFFHSWK